MMTKSFLLAAVGVGAAVAGMAEATFPHASELERFEFSEHHMGTTFTITLYGPDEDRAASAARAAFRRIRTRCHVQRLPS